MILALLNKAYPNWQNIVNASCVSQEAFIAALECKSGKFENNLGISANKATAITKAVFFDKPKGQHIRKWLLAKNGLKDCGACGLTYEFSNFRENNTRPDGLQSNCRDCQLKNTSKTQPQRQAKYRSAISNRTPSWANLSAIKDIYDNCPAGYHVDHIIPLQGINVSGLHVENNLQYLLAKDNLVKTNKFDISIGQ